VIFHPTSSHVSAGPKATAMMTNTAAKESNRSDWRSPGGDAAPLPEPGLKAVKPMTGFATCWELRELVMISSFQPRIDEHRLFVGYTMRPSAAPVLGEVLNCSESMEVGS
jgi:hypothetical protein